MTETAKNIFYAQSGGVTAVINATAAGVIQSANQDPFFHKVLAGQNGILGLLHEELIDTSKEEPQTLEQLAYTPGGAFGSCRFKLKTHIEDPEVYQKLFNVLKAHNIGYFFYNGGGDSQDTCHKMAEAAKAFDYPLKTIGLPKTIDNDLPITDNSPGFGSTAKYVAISMQEACLDLQSMCKTSTKIFVMEVMGRHTGWIAAASGLAQQQEHQGPHVILFPERAFDPTKFLAKVKLSVENYGYCCITVAEGVKDASGQTLTHNHSTDAFGHTQLGGVAPRIAHLVTNELGYKHHWGVLDYLQRSAGHIASLTDHEQAYRLGEAAVASAKAGQSEIMMTLNRQQNSPYRWNINSAPLKQVANQEKFLPDDFISEDGFHITDKARAYLQPLIEGEAYPEYSNGLPQYAQLKKVFVNKKIQTSHEEEAV